MGVYKVHMSFYCLNGLFVFLIALEIARTLSDIHFLELADHRSADILGMTHT